MVDVYLKDCVTQHPGGWQDIIDYVNANYDRYQASYKEVEAISDTGRATYNSDGTLTYERVARSNESERKLPRLEELHHGMAGITASMGWEILRSLGLPLPGSKEWLKPCANWRKDEKGK